MDIPFHLKKYIVEQEATKYTSVDQAVWRFVLRQLKNFLSKNAHESYMEGMKKTGITVEEIPSIENISKSLNQFGWQAAPVSGFIPPASFLELQALKILPIASDMRTIEHLTYTPAPDIVHEAAGHAPMVANPDFRKYLEEYALVARKAIINKKDLELYEAIRDLSDIKEHPNATDDEINEVQKRLNKVSRDMGEPSEASLLARMAWWTTEYGLIGQKNPKIYGAGLLSSAGEGKSALSSETKKIPFSLECINFSYDITEPQPQLFVADSFQTLSKVLEEFSNTMSYKRGGTHGLETAKKAETTNTVEFQNGAQVSGKLTSIIKKNQGPVYLQFTGPCQISYHEKELENQGIKRHKDGFGCPVGKIKTPQKVPVIFWEPSASNDMAGSQNMTGTHKIVWESGVELTGKLINEIKKDSKTLILIFKDCKVTFEGKTLFDPSWGEYDLVLGEKVVSVFGGAADKEAYGEFEDFVAKKIPSKKYSEQQQNLFKLYQRVRDLRKNIMSQNNIENSLVEILKELKNYPKDWLLKLEILELSYQLKSKPTWVQDIEKDLTVLSQQKEDISHFISEGLKLANKLVV
jgi:phenylalanine-4-hydroxylase